MSILEAKVELTVAYHDCDPAGVVWHGNYLKYFDAARCALLDKIGYGYHEMEKSGFLWPLIDVQVRFVKAVHYPATVTVVCRLEEYEYRLKLSYEVFNAAGEVTTRGSSVQVAVDMTTNEMCLGSPPELLSKLPGVEEG